MKQDPGEDSAIALEVANVEGVFLLLILGVVAATLCNMAEMLLAVWWQSVENKVRKKNIKFFPRLYYIRLRRLSLDQHKSSCPTYIHRKLNSNYKQCVGCASVLRNLICLTLVIPKHAFY